MLITKIQDIIGKTAVEVSVPENRDVFVLSFNDNSHYALYHEQDCCESVGITDIAGDPRDLLDEPLIIAEEVEISTSSEPPYLKGGDESNTWTFHRFATSKGSLTLGWLGSSNGYYSENVSRCLIQTREELANKVGRYETLQTVKSELNSNDSLNGM